MLRVISPLDVCAQTQRNALEMQERARHIVKHILRNVGPSTSQIGVHTGMLQIKNIVICVLARGNTQGPQDREQNHVHE